MKIVVDFEQCDSNGFCVLEAPEVFQLRTDDKLLILQHRPSEQLRAKVEAAARACPKAAITIHDYY